MLDWLFNGKEMLESTKSLLIAVGVILIIIITLKILDKAGMVAPLIKTTGKVLSVLLVVAILGTGAYSIAYLNSYYKREGGIYGKLTDYVYNSISLASNEEDETITYDFANLVFKRDSTEEKYSIIFNQQYNSSDHKMKFQDGTKYSIFVYNNEQEYECNDIHYDLEWIHSEYSYVFYNSYQESDVIGDDTLTFDFCFYDNYSYLKITSNADESTIQLWNAYFNKYNFRVVIKVVDDVFEPTDSSIDAIEEGFVKITYYFNDEIYKREVFPTSDGSYTLPDQEFTGEYIITSWITKDGTDIESVSLKKPSHTIVYAHSFNKGHSITFMGLNEDGLYEVFDTYLVLEEDVVDLPTQEINPRWSWGFSKEYQFLGWTKDKTSIKSTGYRFHVYENEIYYAVFCDIAQAFKYDPEQNGYILTSAFYTTGNEELDESLNFSLSYEIPETWNDGANGLHNVVSVYSYALRSIRIYQNNHLSITTYYDLVKASETGALSMMNSKSHIKEIIVPTTVTTIYSNAFDGCSNIIYEDAS